MTAIKTTHVGSLPRSAEVTELIFAAERGEPIDAAAFDDVVEQAVDDVGAPSDGRGHRHRVRR